MDNSDLIEPAIGGPPPGKPLPKIWLLSQGRRGDLDQMQALAQALAWPTVTKTLAFRGPAIPALAPLLLKSSASDPLAPPWPDLIICAEALASVIAQRLRRLSGNRIKLLCLGRPAGSPRHFDLVLTTAQYRLPPAANTVELALPLAGTNARIEEQDWSLSRFLTYGESGMAAETEEQRRMERSKPFPHIVVMVGGANFPDNLDQAIARQLASDLNTYATQRNGTLHFVTSPRTSRQVTDALLENVPSPHHVHAYGGTADNLYRSIFTSADEIIVTSDSVSMLADALTMGKPVYVYPLPRSRRLIHVVSEWCHRHVLDVTAVPLLLRPLAWLFDHGFVETTADRHRLFDRLAAERRIGWFGGLPPAASTDTTFSSIDVAVATVKALFPSLL